MYFKFNGKKSNAKANIPNRQQSRLMKYIYIYIYNAVNFSFFLYENLNPSMQVSKHARLAAI